MFVIVFPVLETLIYLLGEKKKKELHSESWIDSVVFAIRTA